MFKELELDLSAMLSHTVATVGSGTLVAMLLTWALARRQRAQMLEQSDSLGRRETAYQSLSHAVDRFTRQVDSASPMRLRSDWATMAHALETSELLAQGIVEKPQAEIWTIQLEYFRRVTLSELKTQEAFLSTLHPDESALTRFNQQPAERHVAPVIRWVLQLQKPAGAAERLSDVELEGLKDIGLPHLAAQIEEWREGLSQESVTALA